MPYKDLERARANSRERYHRFKDDIRAKAEARKSSDPEAFRVRNLAYQAKYRERNRAACNARVRLSRQRHPETGRAYAEARRDQLREYAAAYNRLHRETLAARAAAYYATHRDAALERQHAYALAYPTKVLEYSAAKRARKAGATVEKVERAAVFARDGGICGECWAQGFPGVVDSANWHLDHIIPLSKGGEHSYANTQVTHPKCNLSKHNKMPHAVAA